MNIVISVVSPPKAKTFHYAPAPQPGTPAGTKVRTLCRAYEVTPTGIGALGQQIMGERSAWGDCAACRDRLQKLLARAKGGAK